MRENRRKTHKSTDFIPKTIYVACRLPFIILYNNSFHPVVLLKNNPNSIFMIILEKVSKGGEIVKQNTKSTDFIHKSKLLYVIILLAHFSRRHTR